MPSLGVAILLSFVLGEQITFTGAISSLNQLAKSWFLMFSFLNSLNCMVTIYSQHERPRKNIGDVQKRNTLFNDSGEERNSCRMLFAGFASRP